MSSMMEYEHISTYLSGADYEANQIKDDWKDIYGENGHQDAINDLVQLVGNMVDLLRQYTLDDRNFTREHIALIKKLSLQNEALTLGLTK